MYSSSVASSMSLPITEGAYSETDWDDGIGYLHSSSIILVSTADKRNANRNSDLATEYVLRRERAGHVQRCGISVHPGPYIPGWLGAA